MCIYIYIMAFFLPQRPNFAKHGGRLLRPSSTFGVLAVGPPSVFLGTGAENISGQLGKSKKPSRPMRSSSEFLDIELGDRTDVESHPRIIVSVLPE